jgi:hypothetical protein
MSIVGGKKYFGFCLAGFKSICGITLWIIVLKGEQKRLPGKKAAV